jgi:hypothetical protein
VFKGNHFPAGDGIMKKGSSLPVGFWFSPAYPRSADKTGSREGPMKECTLDQFSESVDLWLVQNYIRSVTIDVRGRITLTFMDGVKDTFQITGCDKGQVKRACKILSDQGIPVRER